jgi:hypothetical protein
MVTLAGVKSRRATLPTLLVIALWLGAAAALGAATSRVADWFVMTDELLYERLALSIDRLGTVVPHVHGQTVSNLNQLYPLILSIPFRHGQVLHGFHEAHVLNAFVMTSAALPVYLLARRVTHHDWLSLAAAFATATVVWMTLASFLLTEVVAYPAFMWAVLAAHICVTSPSLRNDLLAVGVIAVAAVARTQFYVLAAVLVLAIVAQGLTDRQLRAELRRHRPLGVIYAAGVAVVLVVTATGHHVLGTYAKAAHGNPLPAGILGSASAHLAVVALGGGLLPMLVGGGWIVANLATSESRERQTFAWLAVVAIPALTVEVASFDIRFGGSVVRERYLFYLAPVLFVALAAALTATTLPRWSVAAPLLLLAVGFTQAQLPTFAKLNADTPASVLDDWLRSTMGGLWGARLFLMIGSFVLALLYVEVVALAPRRLTAAGVFLVLAVALPAETAYGFKRLFAVTGTSGLPMTLDQSPVFEWVDREVNTENRVVLIPYPVIPSDYWANVGFWWDLEFWNRSVEYEAGRPNEFSGTPGGSFPKLPLRFDPRTGRANVDPDAFVLQAVGESRFHVAGKPRTTQRGINLDAPARPWRADWVSSGLYDDGWTRGRASHIRVFSFPGQHGRVQRQLTVVLVSPDSAPTRNVVLRSNAGAWRVAVDPAGVSQLVQLCVPANGFADLTVRVRGSSSIPGDPKNSSTFLVARTGGIQFHQIALADELGRC